MNYGICALSIVPCRRSPSGTAEMVSQLLFGDHYTVLHTENDWHHIRIAYDGYECWINGRQHMDISEKEFKALEKETVFLTTDLVHPVFDKKRNSAFPITIGCRLPFFEAGRSVFDSSEFVYEGQVSVLKKRPVSEVISTAFTFLNAPYLWGGKSPFGIDCSGFTQLVFKLNGIKLPRDSHQQAEKGSVLSFVEEAQEGDLAFFDNAEGKITHVGIVLRNHEIIHASGFVRVDKLDHYGIFNNELKRYTHNLRVIKRITA